MINTIIFDLGEVYINGLKGVEYLLEKELGIRAEEIYPHTQGPDLIAFFYGEITEVEYWKRVISKTGWKISVERLKELVRLNFTEVDGTEDIIKSLKKRGYRLGLLSDHGKEWIGHCKDKFGFHKLFHSTLFSFEIAMIKVQKKGFKILIDKMNVLPENCLFIDDNPKNLVPAKEIGMRTILFNDVKKLEKELKDINLL